jgi:hypothetical protein
MEFSEQGSNSFRSDNPVKPNNQPFPALSLDPEGIALTSMELCLFF